MPIKQTVPTNSGDYLQFGNATTPVAAQVGGYEDSTGNGHLELYTTASGTVTERMRIASNGDVGIGTSSFSYSGTGRGLLELNGSTLSLFSLKYSNTPTFYALSSANDIELAAVGASTPMRFTVNSAERMRIDASGNVLIGAAAATCLLSSGPVASKGGIFGSANTAGSPGIQGAHTVNSGTGYVAYFANSGSGTGLYISNTAAWQSTSDVRLKTDIKDLDTTSRLLELRPVDYLWKSQETSDNPEKRNLGFIAQEVQEVFPELVGESPDGMLSVEYTGLIAPLVKAIQELNAKVTVLEAQLGAK
jgi:Chaperone of endosialidase